MEADAILELVPRVDEHFSAAVAMIVDCPGRVAITGMGKSGIIGRYCHPLFKVQIYLKSISAIYSKNLHFNLDF